MTVLASENWSGRPFEESRDGNTSTRTFLVTGTTDELTAIAALDKNGQSMPRINDPHPKLPGHICNGRGTPTQLGRQTWEFTFNYSTNTSGTSSPNENNNGGSPLDARPRYRWRVGTTQEAFDTDVEGNILKNSAGEAFSETIQEEVVTLHCDVVVNKPFFNIQEAIRFTDTVNSEEFVIDNRTIQPMQAICRGITPEREYVRGDEYVPVVYSFEFRPVISENRSGFDLRLLDKGKNAWYTFGGDEADQTVLAPIGVPAATGIQKVSEDIALNGEGIPFDPIQYVAMGTGFDRDIGEQGFAVPENISGQANAGTFEQRTAGAEKLVDERSGAIFLTYQLKERLDFNQLGGL